jgi:hypothetical protein
MNQTAAGRRLHRERERAMSRQAGARLTTRHGLNAHRSLTLAMLMAAHAAMRIG